MENNIIQFRKKTLFKNANLVNLKTGKVELVDILVEDGKIVDIQEGVLMQAENCEIVNLAGGFVIPPFVNVFCNSVKALEKTYGLKMVYVSPEKTKKLFEEFNIIATKSVLEVYPYMLLAIKNLLAGATISLDLADEKEKAFDAKIVCVENISEFSETQLDEIVDKTAKNKAGVFLKVGQDLHELGVIDKTYHKTLSQVLEDFGFLDRHPTIVGGNCLEKDELSLLRDYDCNFVVCPTEDGKEGRRMTNINALKNLKFRVGIGSGYSFEVDFFAFMRQILMSVRSLYEDKNIITEKDVLKMATINGAKIAIGKQIKIAEGENANFIVIKNEESLYNDIFKTLVWEKSKKDVVMVVSNGKILQKDGEILMKNLPNYVKIKSLISTYSEPCDEDE